MDDLVERATRAFVAELKKHRGFADDTGGMSEVILDGTYNLLAAMRAAVVEMREAAVEMASPEVIAGAYRGLIEAVLGVEDSGRNIRSACGHAATEIAHDE